MKVSIIHKSNVKTDVLDGLAKELPVVIAGALEVPGGKLAILKPEQIWLDFSEASARDTGPDIRVMVFARGNVPRTSAENDLAKAILEKIVTLTSKSGSVYSAAIRLYFMEIGAAEYIPAC